MFYFYISFLVWYAIVVYGNLSLLFLKMVLQNRCVTCSSRQNILGKVALFKHLLFSFCIFRFRYVFCGAFTSNWIVNFNPMHAHLIFFFFFLSVSLWKLGDPLFRSPFLPSQENQVKSFCNNAEVYITNKMSFMQFMLHNVKSLSLRHRDLVLSWYG